MGWGGWGDGRGGLSWRGGGCCVCVCCAGAAAHSGVGLGSAEESARPLSLLTRTPPHHTPLHTHTQHPVPCEPYRVDAVRAKALETILVLHMDHEQVGGGGGRRGVGGVGRGVL